MSSNGIIFDAAKQSGSMHRYLDRCLQDQFKGPAGEARLRRIGFCPKAGPVAMKRYFDLRAEVMRGVRVSTAAEDWREARRWAAYDWQTYNEIQRNKKKLETAKTSIVVAKAFRLRRRMVDKGVSFAKAVEVAGALTGGSAE